MTDPLIQLPPLPEWVVVLRLFAAGACGAVLGFERELKGRDAGLRTFVLVALGAAGFTVASLLLSRIAAQSGATPGDPSRIIQAVATGVGFLGAGSILRRGRSVKGLTTAAGLWVAAAIGVAVGSGLYILGAVLTLLGLFTLQTMQAVEPVPRGKSADEE